MPTRAKSEAEFQERFWAKVDKTSANGCWIWTGAKGRSGYGNLRRRPLALAAHRVSYEMANGPIPEGLWVLHSCDNPPCVNPDHLRLGTQRENNAECDAKGRRRKEGTNVAKLTPDDVRTIRRMYAEGRTQREIGEAFGVAQVTISHVIGRRTWAWVD